MKLDKSSTLPQAQLFQVRPNDLDDLDQMILDNVSVSYFTVKKL